MTAPWDTRQIAEPWRLGLMLGPSQHASTSSLGWAAIQLSKPTVRDAAEIETDDPYATALIRARQAIEDGAEGIQLYRYNSERSFAESRAAAEGGSRQDHNRRVIALVAQLRGEGIAVYMTTIR